MVRRARHHEQQIGQPVQVDDDDRLDRVRAQRDDPPLGAAADRAGEVQQRARGAAAGQDEPAQRRQFRLETDRSLLEPLDVGRRMTAAFVTRSAIRAEGSARRAPSANSSRWIVSSDAEIQIGGCPAARAAPRQALSSSTSPYASTRGSAFETRVLSKSDVSPGIAGLCVDLHTRGIIGAGCQPPALPPPAARQRFRRACSTWYRANGRDLPWRHDRAIRTTSSYRR